MLEQFFKEQALRLKTCSIFPSNLLFYTALARFIAEHLIKQDGSLDFIFLEHLIRVDKQTFYEIDHVQAVAKKLFEDKNLQKLILKFDLPITQDFEKFIKLSCSDTAPVSRRSLRVAVTAALFGYLRQTVGSCFATAPCLYILKKHPDYLLEDLYQLSKKTILQRLSSGQLAEVPMAASIGGHFLNSMITKDHLHDSALHMFLSHMNCENRLEEGQTFLACLGEITAQTFYASCYDPLLKIWEYTVASFCDAKGEFTESTLYLTLGLDAKFPDGLGEFFHNIYQQKLDDTHALVLEAQNEAFLAHQRLVMAENIAKNASTESALQRAKSEIVSANYQLHSKTLDLDDLKKDQEKVKQLYTKKIQLIKEHLKDVFQESYDPDLVDMKSYTNDSPAGFRLYVKDGKLVSRLKPILSEDDFVKAIKTFLETLERGMLEHVYDKDTFSQISHVITESIQFTSSKKFLEKTYLRAKQRHEKALPWAYVSGGTLETLLKTYFRKELLNYHTIYSSSIQELLIDLIDHFKSLPDKNLEVFRKDAKAPLLLETSTHACLCLPGSKLFKKFWESSAFTYSDVRDTLMLPSQKFWQNHAHTPIPNQFFEAVGKAYHDQTIGSCLQNYGKEGLYLTTSYLLSQSHLKLDEKSLGLCIIGDTNWTYETLIIGFNPLNQKLSLFAQDSLTKGLIWLDHMEKEPIKWKLYDDLTKAELFGPGIKI